MGGVVDLQQSAFMSGTVGQSLSSPANFNFQNSSHSINSPNSAKLNIRGVGVPPSISMIQPKPKPEGSHACGKCRSCELIAQTNMIESTTNGSKTKIHASLTCTSHGIYAFECQQPGCKEQAISFTTVSFRHILTNLRAAIVITNEGSNHKGRIHHRYLI